MIDTLTLSTFLLERIAEDEVAANRPVSAHWPADWTLDGGGIHAGHQMNEVVDWALEDAGEHIARHDPARVLAECAAKRTIVEIATNRHTGSIEHDDILRALASVYIDHAEFNPEWVYVPA